MIWILWKSALKGTHAKWQFSEKKKLEIKETARRYGDGDSLQMQIIFKCR